MKDPVEETHPFECRTPGAGQVVVAGMWILALALLSAIVLFRVDDAARPLVAIAVMMGGTVALGVYTYFRIRRWVS
jgi:hypothetical protein